MIYAIREDPNEPGHFLRMTAHSQWADCHPSQDQKIRRMKCCDIPTPAWNGSYVYCVRCDATEGEEK